MKRLVSACFVLCLFSASANAAPPAQVTLSAQEAVEACAVALPEQLACKAEFCGAMVDLRKKYQPHFAAVDRGELVKACLAEIAVDGTGDLETRKGRCAAWSKDRPAPTITKADATAAQACFKKGSCGERIACWAPFAERQFAAKPNRGE